MVLKRLAKLIEAREGTPESEVFGAMCGELSRCLAIQAVRMRVRRNRRAPPRAPAAPLAQALHGAAARRGPRGDDASDDDSTAPGSTRATEDTMEDADDGGFWQGHHGGRSRVGMLTRTMEDAAKVKVGGFCEDSMEDLAEDAGC